ncbi:hypothetical protein [Methylicorpusculum sp.]|uniref:hypothetical protein n=1 Tax=Methylicorpusculum sp. TaxID=2713644 RepID=UPI00351F4D27
MDESSEDAEAKSFLDAFFNVFGVPRKRVVTFEKRVKNSMAGTVTLICCGKGFYLLSINHAARTY